MNKLKNIAMAGITAGLMLANFGAVASAADTFTLSPNVYDPSDACTGIEAKWDTTVGNPSPSILLTKPCPTSTNAASQVEINSPLEGMQVNNLTELNFDVKSDEWCGAGAPRFNLQLDQVGLVNAFLGCTYGTHTDLGNGWTHVVFSQSDIQDAVTTAGADYNSATLYDLYIVFDEGNDLTGHGTPGMTHIDNISVNGVSVGSPEVSGNKSACKNGGWINMSNPTFKNQGDCVSYFQSNSHATGNRKDNQ